MDVLWKLCTRLAPAAAILALVLMPLTGCDDDDERPPTDVPDTSGVDIGDVGRSDATGRGPDGMGGRPDAGDVGDVGERDAATGGGPGEVCPFVPRETPTSIESICCFEDLDCADADPAQPDWRCYGASCHEGGEGVCLRPPLNPLTCWTDRDCAADHRCEGAQFARCGERATSGEVMGTCVPRPDQSGVRF